MLLRTNLHQYKVFADYALWFLFHCDLGHLSWVWELNCLETRVRLYSFHPLPQINVLYLFFSICSHSLGMLWSLFQNLCLYPYQPLICQRTRKLKKKRQRIRRLFFGLSIFCCYFYYFFILPLICHSITVIFVFSMINQLNNFFRIK